MFKLLGVLVGLYTLYAAFAGKVIAKSGDTVEEPGDYPFGLNPAGYTSRSMIVICK